MRKLLCLLFVVPFLFFVITPVFAQERQINIYFFNSKDCPHCTKEEVFLEELQDKYPNIEVYNLEITTSRKNLKLLEKVGALLSADVSGVPFTVIGRKYITGYGSDRTTGQLIENIVIEAREGDYQDVVSVLLDIEAKNIPLEVENQAANITIPDTLSVPFLGEIDITSLSLPALTFTIALLDGFNPCAMWVLVFLISFLLGMKSRLQMWLLGGSFILASGLVYFLFLSAWLNLFLFLGFVIWVRLLIGAIAVSAGGYYLYDWATNKSGACKATEGKKRKKIFDKLKEITSTKRFAVALMGIIPLAFAVNLVELICSAGLPAVYTQVLSLSNLPSWQYYMYLLFYIFIFMLDDLFVFIAAMITLKSVGIGTKYARYAHLIGGVIMFLLGLALIFKPELIMFG